MKIFWIVFLMTLLPLPAHAREELPRLTVKGNHLETLTGTPVTLRGVSLCSLEWHKPLEQISTLTASAEKWPVNVIRLPVQAKEWKKSDPVKYIQTRLDPAVQACEKAGVYCIIDWHDIAEWNTPKTAKTLEDFWSRVAPRYAAKKHILYEVFNEPTAPKTRTVENWAAWKKQMQSWVDNIRTKAPNTVLLIGSPHWSQMTDFAAKDPLDGKNLVYVMHLYPNYATAKWDSLFGDASQTVPVFLSEWGWSSQDKAWDGIKGTKEEYGEPLRAYLDAKPHINWTAWSYDPKCAPAMMGADKDMGEFVKDWLGAYAPK